MKMLITCGTMLLTLLMQPHAPSEDIYMVHDDTGSVPRPTRLRREKSPYLLQHAYNPVDWFPWGGEAFEKARQENKPIFLSIGYSTCHWCHVMEHESFEDASVAQVMNEFYVSIKVDREERPDVDQIYMDAAYLITGRGGWPLNVIALPDGRPVFAGTYFRKNDWTRILLYFKDLYIKEPETFDHGSWKTNAGY